MTDDLAAVPSDAELMARVVARDEGAFAQVYDRYVRAIYGTALRYLRDPGAAEDVVQETYLAMWDRSESYSPGEGSLVGWLLSIARHRAIDRVRAAARRPLVVGEEAGHAGDGAVADADGWSAQGVPVAVGVIEAEPHTVAERSWVSAVVRTAVAGMPASERLALELAYDDGLSQAEIAGRLGWPLGTVKTRTRRGLLRLRSMLESVPELAPPARTVASNGAGGAGAPTADAARSRSDGDGVDDGPR